MKNDSVGNQNDRAFMKNAGADNKNDRAFMKNGCDEC